MIPNTIKINLDGERDIYTGIELSVGDINAYGLILEFYKGGTYFDITGYNLAIYAKRAGSNIPIPDVGTVQNGKGYYIIKPSMYAYQGETWLEVVLTDSAMSYVTKVLHFVVRGGFSSVGNAVADEADYTVLSDLIAQAQTAITNANDAAAYANALKMHQYTIAPSNAINKDRADLILGTTNPAQEINNAIAMLHTARNGNTDIAIRIDFLGGTIDVGEKTDGSAIVIPVGYDNIHMYGNGVKITGAVYNEVQENTYSVLDSGGDSCILDGFDIDNTCSSGYGSGLSNTGTNCTITGNTCSSANGTGLYSTGTNCTITGNTCSSAFGAGLYSTGTNCTITGNTCSSGNGNGLYNSGTNCTITGNTCSGGNGLNNSGTNCNITGNACSGYNGLYNTGTNCTITGNTCSSAHGTGLYNGTSLTIDKCVIIGNICETGGISVKAGTCLPATREAMEDVNTGTVTERT